MLDKTIVVMSPKGGVGKTTTAVNLATAIASLNKKTLLIDANLETPHVAVYYGFVGFKYSLEDLLNGSVKIEDVIYAGDDPNFHLLPSRVAKGGKDRTENKLINISLYIKQLEGKYDFIIIDSKPSYDIEFIRLIKNAKSLIVCNPDITSIIEARKIKEKLDDADVGVVGLVLNKINSLVKEQVTRKEAGELTDIKNVWKVREDTKVYMALKQGIPVVTCAPKSWISQDIIGIAKDIISMKI